MEMIGRKRDWVVVMGLLIAAANGVGGGVDRRTPQLNTKL